MSTGWAAAPGCLTVMLLGHRAAPVLAVSVLALPLGLAVLGMWRGEVIA